MAAFKSFKVYEQIDATRMVPVFYNADPDKSFGVMKACYDGGVRVFEFTNRGDKAAEVFASLSLKALDLPGLVLGAGSISYWSDALRFIRLGANFIVGPQFVPGVARVCRWLGVPYIPGCGTVSEVGRAQRAGCEICKVFPGEVLGPAFVKALMAPMPWSRIMVTGGVKPERENLEAWFKAGAECVGMGSRLFPKEAVESGDWAGITERCAEVLATIKGIVD